MMYFERFTIFALLTGLLVLAGVGSTWSRETNQRTNGIHPSIVAKYIHAVIEADRTLYATHVVERMHETGTVLSSERWENRNALPLPAQMLQLSGLRVQGKETGLTYRLASLWPIYQKNGPSTEFERKGLEAVAVNPQTPHEGIIHEGDQKYFTAIYADRAVSQAWVNCHNTHVLSPKRNHQLGDVMGGVIISFPVD